MQGLVVVIVIIAACVLLRFLTRSKIENSASWFQFYTKGTDAGFSFKEIEVLRHLADKSSFEDPTSVFWDENHLDTCIRSLVHDFRAAGKTNEAESQDFLAKLYEYRKRIEMEKPGGKGGISNTHQVSEGQNVRIQLEGYGVFKSQVLVNISHHIIVSKPSSAKMPGIFSWVGQRISVYFWRDQDAGYVFDTDVMDEVINQGIPCLKIAHTDSLSRTQKRRSIRVKVHKSAFLYHLINEEDSNKIETKTGLKCLMEDLSDTGCAIVVGGKADSGLRIKVQFTLNNTPVVMPGIVRSTEYREDKNQSLLHVESDPLPIDIRNQIMGEVFGLLSEDEEDLPFRILNEESGAAQGGVSINKDAEAEDPLSGLEDGSPNSFENAEVVFDAKDAF